MLGLALPASGQYAGPAILSRGEAPAAMSTPTVDFALSLALTGSYTNGLVGVVSSGQSNVPRQSSFGAGGTVGLSGSHSWKHTKIGLAYSGSFTDYFQAGSFLGLSQGLSLGLNHQFSRHVLFNVRENAGWFTYFPPATVSLNSSVPFDPSQSLIPTTDFYDNRTIYSSTQADITYQASSRLSFSIGGGYFTNLRHSSALYSASGETASADVQYRLSRRVTLGGTYSYSRYRYTDSAGGADIHGFGLSLSSRFNRWTEFSMVAGASTVNSSFEQTVPINPAILAILCPPTLVGPCPLTGGVVINHNSLWSPNVSARLSRSFQRGVAYLSAGEYITPGNGLFLTSRAQSATAGYGYSGLRKWSMNIGVTYIRALSLGNIDGGYGQVSGNFGVSRQLVGGLSVVSSFSETQYRSSSFDPYNRLIYTASFGLGFSTKNIPVRFF
jgi:hypothetical protein